MDSSISRWRPWPLVASLLCGVALFVTYLAPGTAALWHALDVRAAFALNGLVTDSHSQQLLWALGNLRASDFVIAAIMLAVIVYYMVRAPGYTAAVRSAQAVVICVSLVVLVTITRDLIFTGIDHDSPSLVLNPFTLLGEVTEMDVKSASHTSFPGDHATVLATFVYLLWAFAGRRYGLVGLIIAVIAAMPRMVAGAHWLTDVVVGGVGTALVTAPWIVCTPIGPWLVDCLARLFARVTLPSRYRDMAAMARRGESGRGSAR